MADLSYQQLKFIYYYEGNATEAAIKAGYSKKTAYSQGQRLLKNVEVQKVIEQRLKKVENAAKASREEREALLSEIARNNKAVEVEELGLGVEVVEDAETGKSRLCIAKASDRDKIKAIDTLNKMDGLYVQKHEVGVSKELLEAILKGLPDGISGAVLAELRKRFPKRNDS